MAPATGERFFRELPSLNAATFQLCVAAFAQAFPDSLNILLRDNSGAHTAPRIRWPENVRYVWLPPDCPELNPIERVWRDLKDDLAWQQFPKLDAQQDYVGHLSLQRYLTRCRLPSPFSVRQKGAVVALLSPRYQVEDVRNRQRF